MTLETGSCPCESSCRSGGFQGPAQHSAMSTRKAHTSAGARLRPPLMSICLQKLRPAVVLSCLLLGEGPGTNGGFLPIWL